MTNPFAFIVGNPRSGTTLLRHILDTHSQIAFLLESPWMMNWFEKEVGVSADGFVSPGLVPYLMSNRRLFRDVDLGLTADELNTWVATPGGLSWQQFISRLCDRYGQARGKTYVGNKTPGFVRKIAAMHRLWPETKFIHIVRDGRDVFLSARAKWKEKPNGPQFNTWTQDLVSTVALWWEWNVRLGREAGQLLGSGLYYEIHYEQLVADPENQCVKLCEFLNVPFELAMLRHEQQFQVRLRKDGGVINASVALPITPGLRNWQHEMTSAEIECFEAVAGGLLDELGYPRGAQIPTAEILKFAHEIRLRFEGYPLPKVWG